MIFAKIDRRRCFTLIELLVVIAIIAILKTPGENFTVYDVLDDRTFSASGKDELTIKAGQMFMVWTKGKAVK